MGEITANVNWLAVIVGAVLAFVLGAVWYSPMLFGKKWAEGVGVELGSASTMPVGAMVSQAIGLLLVSWVVGVTAANNALFTFVLVFVAFACMSYSGGLFTRKPAYANNTDTGYLLAVGLVMFIVQAIL
ncbi:MAG TPA: DUF1761 domain-containing protein [Devosiaceae bacterium]